MKLSFCAMALFSAALLSGPAPSRAAEAIDREELRLLANVFAALKQNSIEPGSDAELIEAAIRGMVRKVDPADGRFYTPDEVAKMGRVRGEAFIGLNVTGRDGEVMVYLPVPGSPAEKAGIRPKDVLQSVDGTPVNDDSELAVKLMSGKTGTIAKVVVRRAGKLLTFAVPREQFKAEQVVLSMTPSGVAVLRMGQFAEDTLSTVARALADQWSRQPFKGLVLDLRRHTGGLFEPAIGVAALFLPAGSVVTETKGRVPDSNAVYLADRRYYAKSQSSDPLAAVPEAARRIPLVVLVDEGTSAGAEIVVAALKHHHRARIVGRPTFGKSNIQIILPFRGGAAMKITTAYWFTPGDESIEKVGIAPDVFVQSEDPRIELSRAVGELRAFRN